MFSNYINSKKQHNLYAHSNPKTPKPIRKIQRPTKTQKQLYLVVTTEK